MARTYADTSGTGPLAFVDDVSVQGHMLIRYHVIVQWNREALQLLKAKLKAERPTNKQQWLQ